MGQLEEMKVFVEIAKAESITGAAHRLNMAPSAVSRRLKDLESRLGVQLLIRTTRQVRLAEAGQLFLDNAIRILEDVQEAEEGVVANNEQLSGTLKISAPIGWGLETLTPLITRFMGQHNALNVELELCDWHMDLMNNGIDLAIRIGALPDSSLIARKLAEAKMHVLASPDYLARNKKLEKPQDLEELDGLLYRGSGRSNIWYWSTDRNSGSKRHKITMSPRILSNNGEMLAEAASSGLGVTLLPNFLCTDKMKSGELVDIFPEYVWGDVAIYAVYPPTKHLATRTRMFIDFLSENIS